MTTDGNTTSYATMASGLLNPTFSTLLSNSIIPVQPSSSNLTYNTQFFGPAVSCAMAGDEAFAWAKAAMLDYENMTSSRVSYFGWSPQPGWGPDVNGSFFASTDLQIGNNRLDIISTDAARVFIYLNTTGIDENSNRIPDYSGPSEAQMLTCKLYNASYDTHFEVLSTGAQFITAKPTFQNWMPALSMMPGTPDDPRVSRQMNMQAVMESFAMMVIGPVVFSSQADFPAIDSVYALTMNQALWPSIPALTQTEMTMRQASQYEALFQNITLSMRYSVVAGYVLLLPCTPHRLTDPLPSDPPAPIPPPSPLAGRQHSRSSRTSRAHCSLRTVCLRDWRSRACCSVFRPYYTTARPTPTRSPLSCASRATRRSLGSSSMKATSRARSQRQSI